MAALVCMGIASVLVRAAPPEATAGAGAVSVDLAPVKDAFVRAAAPTLNYGGAGAMAVAGTTARNGLNIVQGRFDSLMQFDAGEAAASFDEVFGFGMWKVTDVRLVVTEVGSPNNLIFNRGVGQFQVRWFNVDHWLEGTGGPNDTVVGTGNVVNFNWVSLNVPAAQEVALGTFVNGGSNGTRTFVLSLAAAFVDELLAGEIVSLHALPVSTGIGFTFHCIDFPDSDQHPYLQVTAEFSCDPDGVENLVDWADLRDCVSGPGIPTPDECACSDFDGDGDVDLLDSGLFQIVASDN
ncbi:MAG: hypothetical protein HOP29_20225 [Phycisphaerales bacterium]|nr:hypothetical protein [Phycisphaerales bacterium]